MSMPPNDDGIQAAITGAMAELGVDITVTPSAIVPPVTSRTPVSKTPTERVKRPNTEKAVKPVENPVPAVENGGEDTTPVSTVEEPKPTQETAESAIPVITEPEPEPVEQGQVVQDVTTVPTHGTVKIVTDGHVDVLHATESTMVVNGQRLTFLQLVLSEPNVNQTMLSASSENQTGTRDSESILGTPTSGTSAEPVEPAEPPKKRTYKPRASHNTAYDSMTLEQLKDEKARLTSMIAKEPRDSEEWNRLKKLRRQVRSLIKQQGG